MAHYCKCMNVNIHLVVEKMLNINDVKVEYKEWMDEDVRDVLRNDLRLEVVKIGSSMTGVQFNVPLLCTKDPLSYYEEITSEKLSRVYDEKVMNYQVISCQNCDMICALYAPEANRYYLNDNMMCGSAVEELKHSDEYSTVFNVIPQHTLNQEQTITIKTENFPSLRKLQLHMQSTLMQEKVAMENRIKEFAEKERKKYSQFFKRTNVERTKLFLRAQHVIKHRRPDFESNPPTDQESTQDIDENTVFGDQLSDSFSSDYASQLKQAHSTEELRNTEYDDDDIFNSDDESEMDQLYNDVQEEDEADQIQKKQKRKKLSPSISQSYRDLRNQSYFYRMNVKNSASSNKAIFGFDEEDGEASETSESEDENVDESEADQDQLDSSKPVVVVTNTAQNVSKAINQSLRPEPSQSDAIYSSSLPVQIPKRSTGYRQQQQQLQLALLLEKDKKRNETKDDKSSSKHEEEPASTDEEAEEKEEEVVQAPIYASLVSGTRRVQNRSIRRRHEDDDIIGDQPSQSYIERYMDIRNDFFNKSR